MSAYFVRPSVARDCDVCHQFKPASEFRTRHFQVCSDCQTKRRSRMAKERKTPETARRHHLKTRYGMSLSDYDDLLKAQDYKCAICHEPKEPLYVDHDHLTGQVRGLLCQQCNLALGLFGDDNIDRLKSAVSYLEQANMV